MSLGSQFGVLYCVFIIYDESVTKNRGMFYKYKSHDYIMKANKLFLVLAGFFILVSFLQITSACSQNRYNDLNTNDDVIFIIKNTNQDDYGSTYWENEDRLPVNNYRHGYSYRASNEYKEDLNERIYKNTYVEYDHSYNYPDHQSNPRYDSRRVRFQEKPEYYYTYDDYMRSYSKHECYSNPPSDKLIYVKCP